MTEIFTVENIVYVFADLKVGTRMTEIVRYKKLGMFFADFIKKNLTAKSTFFKKSLL